MIEEPANEQLLLSVLRELGPVVGHRAFEIELALFDEAMRADRGPALGRGEDVDQRVRGPLGRACRVAVTARTLASSSSAASLG